MTSNLKCPICGGDIQYNGDYSTYDCQNNPSEHYASEELWQALIQAKQDLKIVVDALKPFADRDNWDFEHCFIDNPQLLAGTALEQIEQKRKNQ